MAFNSSSFQYLSTNNPDELISFSEVSPSIDDIASNYIQVEEVSPSIDQSTLILETTLTFDEPSPSTDSFIAVSGLIDVLQCGVTIEVESYDLLESGATIEIEEYDANQFTTNIDVIPYSPVPVTNASSLTNPFTPTVILNGNYVVQNPITDPGTSSGITSFIAFNCGAIAGISLSDIYSFSLNLNDLGGTFEIISKNPPGGLGSHIPIFGLLGTITKLGRIASNSAYGYVTSGIFGSSNLNNQLIFEVSSNLNVAGLIPNQTLKQPNVEFWQTYMTAAMAIANAAQISLAWMVNDAPLVDFYPQSGITALNALSTLAEGVGAKLRWFGNNQYVVVYPNQPLGAWNLLSCSFLNSGGLRYQYLLNVENDFPIVVFPGLAQYDSSQTQVLSNPGNTQVPGSNKLAGGGFSTVQRVGGFSKFLNGPSGTDKGDPAYVFPIPDNAFSVYIQTIIPYLGDLTLYPSAVYDAAPSDSLKTNAADPVDENSNREIWTLVTGVTQGVSVQTVFGADGTAVRQVVIDHNFFTTGNTSIDAGQFTVNVGIVTLSLDNQFKQAQQESTDQQNYIMSQQVLRYKFIPIYEGSIDAKFWGALPLPGMLATASAGGITVTGVIEEVSLSFPANLSIHVKQYEELSFLVNFTNLTANDFGRGV